MTFINLPVLKSCVVEDEIEGADDCVEDHLLLLQLDVHLQVEQHPGNLLYLKSTVLNYFEAKAISCACPFSMTLKICFNFLVYFLALLQSTALPLRFLVIYFIV
jgi:hypothetical protein